MEKLNEFIRICNNMYTKQIKKLINILENTNLDKSCKNNLCAAGDLIVDILKLIQTNKISVALPCIRNVYEMTLKAIVLEDSEEIKDIFNYYIVTFLVYPIILVYIDAVCTRLDLKELDTGNFVIYTIITINILNMLFKDKNKIEKIKKLSEKVVGEPDELFQVRIEKEKELFNYYRKDSSALLKNNSIHQTEFNNFLESYLKKYFTKNQIEKIVTLLNDIFYAKILHKK